MKHEPTFPVSTLSGIARGQDPRIFYHHRKILVSRKHNPQPYRYSDRQRVVLALMKSAQREWRLLSPEYRHQWELYSLRHPEFKTGVRFIQPAYNMFLRACWIHLARYGVGFPQVPVNPILHYMQVINWITFEPSTGRLYVSLNASCIMDHEVFFYFRISPGYSHANRRAKRSEFRCINPPGNVDFLSYFETNRDQVLTFYQPPYSYQNYDYCWLEAIPVSDTCMPGSPTLFQCQVAYP